MDYDFINWRDTNFVPFPGNVVWFAKADRLNGAAYGDLGHWTQADLEEEYLRFLNGEETIWEYE